MTDNWRSRRPIDSTWTEENAKNILAYEMLTLRDVEKDALLWQAPTLALTAQAFLLTIALNPEVTAQSALMSAALGFIVALMSVQLMAKHRRINLEERAYLHYLETQLGMPHLSWHNFFYGEDGTYAIPDWFLDKGARTKRWRNHSAPVASAWFIRISSFTVWIWGLSTFAAANLFLIIQGIGRLVGF